MRPSDLDGVEFLPEPGEPRILTAVDPSAVQHEAAWRSEVMGWAPRVVTAVPHRKRSVARSSFGLVALLVVVGMIVSQGWFLVEIPLGESEWAFENTGLRDLSEEGFDGTGVRLCVVDTGIDASHPAFEGQEVVFRDFVGSSRDPLDRGATAHGTMMVGLLVAEGHQDGAAQGVTLGVAAALAGDSDGDNIGDDSIVAEAIDWCRTGFDADLISLSLGGKRLEGQRDVVVSSVRRALDDGVFVVAAAGNDGGTDDDGRVASPAFLPRVIAVGATNETGAVWENSSRGDGTGEHPNLKPEVTAPGVNVISTGSGDAWFTSSGTSVSTVLVSAALALILEAQPELKVDDDRCVVHLKHALRESLGASHSPKAGYGELDAMAWFEAVDPSCPVEL
ncbi:MAG: hypothetical protein CMA56_04170 [Euryarchaeota archaeon]|nr:hypothetical protein [Euryarchaeota archaeon]